MRLADNLKTSSQDKLCKEVFVLHNWKDTICLEEASRLWETQVIKPFKTIESELHPISVTGSNVLVPVLKTPKTRHLFYLNDMTNDEKISQHNEAVILLLREWFRNSSLPPKRAVIDLLVEKTQKILPQYTKGDFKNVRIREKNEKEAILCADSETPLSLSPFTSHPFMGIIPNDAKGIQYFEFEHLNQWCIIVYLPGCAAKISSTNRATRRVIINYKKSSFVEGVPDKYTTPLPDFSQSIENRFQVEVPLGYEFPDELKLEEHEVKRNPKDCVAIKRDGVIKIYFPVITDEIVDTDDPDYV